jgi:ubiquinol-cytochrome c reductase iron-sulfur subunit
VSDGNGRIVPPGEPDRRAETWVLILLALASLCAVAFIVIYAVGAFGQAHRTQYLGVAIGLALAFIAAALIVTSKRLVVSEENEDEYHEPPGSPEEQEAVVQIVAESGSRMTRKRLLGFAAGTTGGALGAALITPALSFGPVLDPESLTDTPWYRGRRLVDEHGTPYRAGDIEIGSFYTAYPEKAAPEQIGAPVVVVRVDPAELELPAGRQGWAPMGILAYSKVCTHAGCAVALYRKPLFPDAEPKPALVCPCHYSTFDPAKGAAVLFGPAGRPLPQLPLGVTRNGYLVATGNLSSPPGPSWWGSRSRKATN